MTDLAPGTIYFTRGSGLVGWLIRRSGSFWAHTGVVRKRLPDGSYSVVEAFFSRDGELSGVRFRVQRFDGPAWQYRFVDLGDAAGQLAVLAAAEGYAVRRVGYDLVELVRIAARGLRIRWDRPSNDQQMICSHHVARSVVRVFPEFEAFLPCPVGSVWPGALLAALDAWLWQVDRG